MKIILITLFVTFSVQAQVMVSRPESQKGKPASSVRNQKPNMSFDERKSTMLEMLKKRKVALESAINCVEGTKDMAALKVCGDGLRAERKTHRESMQERRAQRMAKRKAAREAMKKAKP